MDYFEIEAIIVLLLMAVAGAVSVMTLWRALFPAAARPAAQAAVEATGADMPAGTQAPMPSSGVESSSTQQRSTTLPADWPAPASAADHTSEGEAADTATDGPCTDETPSRKASGPVQVTVHVRDTTRTTIIPAGTTITPQQILEELFTPETNEGSTVRFIQGGRVRSPHEVLSVQDSALVLHAVVSAPRAGSQHAPRAAGGTGSQRAAPPPHTHAHGQGAHVGLGTRALKLLDERPGTVFFVVFTAFLALMWAVLLSSPELMQLPARVTLGLLTLAAVVLRPQT